MSANPLLWVLKHWCRDYLEIDSEAEALVLQLNARPVVLRSVSLNADTFNARLVMRLCIGPRNLGGSMQGTLGLELQKGHVSQAELCVKDWANCEVLLEMERVFLSVSPTMAAPVGVTEREEVDAAGNTFSSLLPLKLWWKTTVASLEVWFKRFLMNLEVRVQHLIIHVEVNGSCVVQLDMHDVLYSTEENGDHCVEGDDVCPGVTAGSMEVSLPDTVSDAQSYHRIFRLENVSLQLMVSMIQQWKSALHASAAEFDITPEAVVQLLELKSLFCQGLLATNCNDAPFVPDANSSLTGSEIFFDAEQSSRAGSVCSDATEESVYFDCDEVMSGASQMVRDISMTFSIQLDRIHALLRSTTSVDCQQQISFHLEHVHCSGTYNTGLEVDLSIRRLESLDRSPAAMPASIDHSRVELPETLMSLLTTHAADGSYLRFGFRQLQQNSSITISIRQDRQQSYSVSLSTPPLIFWSNCEAVRRCMALLEAFSHCRPKKPQRNSEDWHHFSFEWHTNGIFGALEMPNRDERPWQRLLFVELKTATETPFLSCRAVMQTRQLLSHGAAEHLLSSLSVAELSFYQCLHKDHSITKCSCIVTCSSQGPTTSAAPAGNGLSIVVTKAFRDPQSLTDLSSIAHRLVHIHSQNDTSSFHEQMLCRVEYEGKCVQSANLVCELEFDWMKLDVDAEKAESCLDALLHFWCPAKMADQMRTNEDKQAIFIINAHHLDAQFQNCVESHEADALRMEMKEMELFLVSGLQKKTISTLTVTVGSLEASSTGRHQLCRIGNGDDVDRGAIQFFQVSELDFRNAKFKQWSALQQRSTRLCIDRSALGLKWIVQAGIELLNKNKDRIQSDVEVENVLSFVCQDMTLQCMPEALSQRNMCLECRIDRGALTVKDLKRLEAELNDLELLLMNSAEGQQQKFLQESLLRLQGHRRRDGIDLELRNQSLSVTLNPDLLSDLLKVVHTIRSVCCLSEEVENAEMDIDDVVAPGLLQGISANAFSSMSDPKVVAQRSRWDGLIQHEEDEDGFIVIEDLSTASASADLLRRSHSDWLNGGSIMIHDDYISIPEQFGFIDDDGIGVHDEHCEVTSQAKWTIRFVDLSANCAFADTDLGEHIDLRTEGWNVVYAVFEPGSVYQSRLTASVQEFEIIDRRSHGDGKRIAERNKSQLRTQLSKRCKHQQTMSAPMVQLSVESVCPDESQSSQTKEKRVALRFVPLRLRHSNSFSDFIKCYLHAVSSNHDASVSNEGEGTYFQLCRVSAFFIVVDYQPRRIDLERLKRGKTSELINMVQWEGMELFLNEIKLSGVAGWSALSAKVIQSWTHDISHSQRHRLLSGFPAMRMFKRISPAAQDVVHAIATRVKHKDPVEVQVRGTHVPESPPLSRALGEFGRVLSLEVLNICATGTEGIHCVLDDPRSAPPTDAQSGLHQARQTLRTAAQSLITEPWQSAQSGEGIGVAMTKALRSFPKALLAPASAATTVMHGTLRSACNALDTDNVLDS